MGFWKAAPGPPFPASSAQALLLVQSISLEPFVWKGKCLVLCLQSSLGMNSNLMTFSLMTPI